VGANDVLPGQLALFAATELTKPDPERLKLLRAESIRCQKCGIRKSCKQPVFGEGNPDRPLVAFVGDAPNAVEAAYGRPLLGSGGALLDQMIKAMKLEREALYVCNVLGCYPPGDRPPMREELANCREWTSGQLRLVQPRSIVALGAVAANALLDSKKPELLHKLRGSWHDWQGIPMRVSFHPSHLLRHRLDKANAWTDLQELLKKLRDMEVVV
jgi:DNA polymerase